MNRLKLLLFIFSQCLIPLYLCDLSLEQKDRLVNGYVDFYNKLPNQIYTCEEGYLQNAREIEPNKYTIEVNLRVTDIHNLGVTKYMKCNGEIAENEGVLSVVSHSCTEDALGGKDEEVEEEVTENVFRTPIQLDNEVQTGTTVTSGEQFVAIPREDNKVHCIGCSSQVNPEAAGVKELAQVGVAHLDTLEPNVKHTLNKVVQVERQVQVVSGVRYILTLLVDYNSCATPEQDSCLVVKPCKISVLEKPWVKLADGSKYRAILSNNCTEAWIFDDGKETPTPAPVAHPDSDDNIKVITNHELQSPKQTHQLTEDDIKNIEEQIISYSQKPITDAVHAKSTENAKDHGVKDEIAQTITPNTIPLNRQEKIEPLSEDKKKAVDDLLNFFSFSGFDDMVQHDDNVPRQKRSFISDLNVLRMAQKYHKLKMNLENAKYIYKLAQHVLNQQNAINFVENNRVLKDILHAEEEYENNQHFYYIQYRTVVPCDKSKCDDSDLRSKICNCVVDTSNKQIQILSQFCIEDEKTKPFGKVVSVAIDDPVLLELVKESVKKIEKESSTHHAIVLNNIIDANTQIVSGSVTKISIILDYLNCNKSVPLYARQNCSRADRMGSQICEVIVLERNNQKEISYACTPRPVDMSFTIKKTDNLNKSINYQDISDMVQEALRILEYQSNKRNKQVVVKINSVSTKLVSGFLTDIEFVVGYTTCLSHVQEDTNENCKLLDNMPLRICNAKVWDRTWIEDSKQVDVSCKNPHESSGGMKSSNQLIELGDDVFSNKEQKHLRKKRSYVTDSIERKRGVKGGPKDQDPKDPKYLQLAEESMTKYLQSSGKSEPHRVVAVDSVTTQVVSGSRTKIEFHIAPHNGATGDVLKCHSDIWEQPWLNKKEIKVDCRISDDHNSRSKRGVPGGENKADPKDPKYLQLAEESMTKYLQSSGKSEPHRVVAVDSVTTQVVSGSRTKIEFHIAPHNGATGDVLKCHSDIWEQPWLNKKEIKVDCRISDDHNSRSKRGVPGGEIKADPKDPKYLQLAEESMTKYLQSSGKSEPHRVVAVDSVTTQVVSGSRTKIEFHIAPHNGATGDVLKCHSDIWEQPWLNKKEIKVDCRISDDHNSRSKRGLPGGENNADPKDPKYLQLAEESMTKYLQSSGKSEPHRVVAVDSVTTQVVSGSRTKIEFHIAPHNGATGDVLKCHSDIWEQPWLNKKEIKVDCRISDDHNSRSKRGLLGGENNADPKDPKYLQLAEESMTKYLQSSGKSEPHRVVAVDSVTTQVVSGSRTKIEFHIAPHNGATGDVLKCHSDIWEQPWLNKKEIKVDCRISDDHNSRSKRGLPGGENNADPKDPKYLQLAEESMTKYLQSSGKSEPHRVVAVDSVTTQVVSGSRTKIEFHIAPHNGATGDVLKCHSDIWEQPWLNKKEIKVDCRISDDHNSRSKRGLLGGENNADPKDPKYLQLAEESMTKYLQSSGKSEPHRVVAVDSVTTQVVSGSRTKIEFHIAPHNGATGDVLKCHSDIWEQPWLNKKEIKVDCRISDDHNSRSKRGLLGGENNADPKDPKYLQLAEESMTKYLQSSGKSEPHRVVAVDSVTTQVVSGSRTKIEFHIAPHNGATGDVLKCHSDIWEQPWLNKKEIKVDCRISDDHNSRSKRGLPGGENKADPKDPKYLQLAEESMTKYLQSSGKSEPHRVVTVDSVTTQVVSGSLTNISFHIAPDGKVGEVLECHSLIWEQPWKKFKDIKVECYIRENNNFAHTTLVMLDDIPGKDFATVNDLNDQYNQRFSYISEKIENTPQHKVSESINDKDAMEHKISSVKGSNEEEENPNKPLFRELAKESLKKYLKLQKSTIPHRVVEVKKVMKKVVSGIIYQLSFTAVPKSCRNDIDCSEGDSSLRCHAKVWIKPGSSRKNIDVMCDTKKSRRTRSIHDTFEIDNNNIEESGNREKRQTNEDEDLDEDIKFYYADRAIQYFNDQSKSNNLHKLTTIHATLSKLYMGSLTVRMFIEIAETYCLRNRDEGRLPECEELDGFNHKVCFVRLYPESDDEYVVKSVGIVCDDEEKKFESVTGVSVKNMLRASIKEVENDRDTKYKLVHLGEPQWIPTLDYNMPHILNFIIATTNCTKDVAYNARNCFILHNRPSQSCRSFIWLDPKKRVFLKIEAKCTQIETRTKRSVSMTGNATADEIIIKKLVHESIEKLEMSSTHRYKQRLLKINSYSTKVTSGRVTTIDFDVGYTSCLKFEWIENERICEFIAHLPRKHCVSQIWERLWLDNGKNIEVTCEDEVAPLETHIQFENIDTANGLAEEALKYIEAKYPHPRKQKVIRIFSLDKQVVAGIHYRMKLEIGLTNCSALSADTVCTTDPGVGSLNKFCRVNVWLRPWIDHPPNYRVFCDYQEGATGELYHHLQAESLFHEFLTTYKPEYINDHKQLSSRFKIFKSNIKKIHDLNTHEKGTARYGVTRFTDLSYEEFTAKYLGLKPSMKNSNFVPMRKAEIPPVDLPEKFDWREFHAVTEVKDQGSCGSCWAFSVTGNIEGQWMLHSGKLVSLSEQELVDCDKLDDGCNGGLPDNAYRAIEQLGGLETESDYPYEGEDDKCSFNKTLSRVQISGAVNISSNETDMAKWLVQKGPISIGINANAMQFYMGGVSHPWKMLCNPTNLDHGVLIVGFGVKDYPLFHKRLPYWIVKNSWGQSWGESGYYRVYRGDGTCGVNQMASSAVI